MHLDKRVTVVAARQRMLQMVPLKLSILYSGDRTLDNFFTLPLHPNDILCKGSCYDIFVFNDVEDAFSRFFKESLIFLQRNPLWDSYALQIDESMITCER